jgi:anti-sigma regulatory factor (Ser/Thr protein kinase)
MTRVAPPPLLRHQAFFYRGVREYVDGLVSFLAEGQARHEPAIVAIPGKKADLIRESVDTRSIEIVDISELGRNPRRLIPAICEFVQGAGDRAVRVVSELQWPTRSPAETAEAIRQEALVNLALESLPVTMLCPYDVGTLASAMVVDAARAHPEGLRDGIASLSESYEDPIAFCSDDHWPLSPRPQDRQDLEFGELAPLRRSVGRWALAEGLDHDRADDLVLSVNELASNSILHAGGQGVLSIWQDDRALMCEVRDTGVILDPLVGTYGPGPDLEARGLWLVNHLCDLVEIRSGRAGTQVRITMNR